MGSYGWKKIWVFLSNFWGWFLQLFVGKKIWNSFKNIVGSALKSCIKICISFIYFLKFFKNFFWGENRLPPHFNPESVIQRGLYRLTGHPRSQGSHVVNFILNTVQNRSVIDSKVPRIQNIKVHFLLCTAKRKLERLQFSTSSSFLKCL